MSAIIKHLGIISTEELTSINNKLIIIDICLRSAKIEIATQSIINEIRKFSPKLQTQLLLHPANTPLGEFTILGMIILACQKSQNFELLEYLLKLIEQLKKDNHLTNAAIQHLLNAELRLDPSPFQPLTLITNPLALLCQKFPIIPKNRQIKLQLIAKMIDMGANVNPDATQQKAYKALPIIEASQANETDVLQLLLEKKARVDTCNSEGQCAIYLATYKQNQKAVELLIRYKASLNIHDMSGFAPLHVAATNNSEAIVKLLLNAKADPNLLSGSKYGRTEQTHSFTPLGCAANSGKTSLIKVLGNSENVNQRNIFGQTALFLADSTNDMQALLDLKADLNLRDLKGETVLFHYTRQGNLPALQFLVAAKADIHARNVHENTLLHIAAFTAKNPVSADSLANNLSMIKFLVQQKVEVNAVDDINSTALEAAITKKNLAVVEFFLTANEGHPIVDFQISSMMPNRELMLKTFNELGYNTIPESPEEVKNFLDNCSDADRAKILKEENYFSQENSYSMPIHIAAMLCDDEISLKIVTCLITAHQKKDPNEFQAFLQSPAGFELLVHATKLGYLPLFKVLVGLGINIYQKSSKNYTLLFLLASTPNIEAFKFLIEYSNAQFSKSKTLEWMHENLLANIKISPETEDTYAALVEDYDAVAAHGMSLSESIETDMDRVSLAKEIFVSETAHSKKNRKDIHEIMFMATFHNNMALIKYLAELGEKPALFEVNLAYISLLLKGKAKFKYISEISEPIAREIINFYLKSILTARVNAIELKPAVEALANYVLENIRYCIPKSSGFVLGFPFHGSAAFVFINQENCVPILMAIQEKIKARTSENSIRQAVPQVLRDHWLTKSTRAAANEAAIREDKQREDILRAQAQLRKLKETLIPLMKAIQQQTSEIEAFLATSESNVNQGGYFLKNPAKKAQHELNNRTVREELKKLLEERQPVEKTFAASYAEVNQNDILEVIEQHTRFIQELENQSVRLNAILGKVKNQIATESLFLNSNVKHSSSGSAKTKHKQKNKSKSHSGSNSESSKSSGASGASGTSNTAGTSNSSSASDKKSTAEKQAPNTFMSKTLEMEAVLQQYQLSLEVKQKREQEEALKQLDAYFQPQSQAISTYVETMLSHFPSNQPTLTTLENYSLAATKVEAKQQRDTSNQVLEFKIQNENHKLLEHLTLLGNLGQSMESLKKLCKGANKLRNRVFYQIIDVNPTTTEIRTANENLAKFLKATEGKPIDQKNKELTTLLLEIDPSGFLVKLSSLNKIKLNSDICKSRIESDFKNLKDFMSIYRSAHDSYPIEFFQSALGSIFASIGNFAAHLKEYFNSDNPKTASDAKQAYFRLSKQLQDLIGVSLQKASVIGQRYRHLNLIPKKVYHSSNGGYEIQYRPAEINWQTKVLAILKGPKFASLALETSSKDLTQHATPNVTQHAVQTSRAYLPNWDLQSQRDSRVSHAAIVANTTSAIPAQQADRGDYKAGA